MMERTKIVATIGPASESAEVLEKITKAGVDVCRLNFSHGTHSWHGGVIKKIRTLEKKIDRKIGIIADLMGPRIRVGKLKDEVTLKGGQTVALIPEQNLEVLFLREIFQRNAQRSGGIQENPEFQISNLKHLPHSLSLLRRGKGEVIPLFLSVTYTDMSKDVKVGDPILIADGLIELRVERVRNETVEAKVIRGGVVTSGRGMNFPRTKLSLPCLTEKDKDDLTFALSQGVDFIALSFVQNAKDIKEARRFIGEKACPFLIAKIELQEAVKNFKEILAACNGIMIARGDLGIETPPEEVPLLQKDIIGQCLKAKKPVIVATQMMESMKENPRPTRAEVSDVANAVIDHADAVMLSEETAQGKYPLETVGMMNKTIRETEASRYDDLDLTRMARMGTRMTRIVEKIKTSQSRVKAILLACENQEACAQAISHLRPELPIFTPCPNAAEAGHLTLSWGIYSFVIEAQEAAALIKKSISYLKKKKLVRQGDQVMIVENTSSRVMKV